MSNARERIRKLSQEYIARGDLTGWHEQIYADANGDPSGITWADLEPNPNLTGWFASHSADLSGKRALVVGCGLGDDAEYLASHGMTVTAFDISPTAIDWCKQRFPDSQVNYAVASVLAVPSAWLGAFDWVIDCYTLQVIPSEIRQPAAKGMADCVAPQGNLLLIARGRDEDEMALYVPWPLTRAELNMFTTWGFREISFDDYMDGDTRRFRAVYQKG